MDKVSLEAQLRKDKVNKVRQEGFVPAVLYGFKIEEPLNLQMDYNAFGKAYEEAGESTIISLAFGKDSKDVLIKAIQKDPIKDTFMHIDFYAINMSEKITAEVEIIYVGTSRAVKDEGGVLVKNFDKVEVEALPADLPKEFTVNISSLKTFEDTITIKDIEISDKVEIKQEGDEIIATVMPPRSEEELAELEEEVEEKVEDVEGVKKEEAEGEGEEGAEAKEAPTEEKKDDDKKE
ncbi:50S ribosomal protein L25 [Patescibacteria group bacterium]|nr:50S ribosomal protein L25 [Patescibacteria group bacterium]